MRANSRKESREQRNARARTYYSEHRDERIEAMRNRRAEHGDPKRSRRIAELGYEFDGACEICGDDVDVPNVDHDHLTGKARGYLCRSCNLGLGNFKDSSDRLTRAIAYLNAH